MLKKRLATVVTAAALLVLPQFALAKPQVSLAMKAETDVLVKKEGKVVRKRVAAKNVAPGKTVFYTVTYKNDGDQKATDVVIDNPIPAGAKYLPGSATGDGEITFSIDKGKTFNKPTLLTYQVKDGQKPVRKVASPDEYTNIRWVIPAVDAGKQGQVGYQVVIK